jgi:phosphate transport system permease protein
MERREAIAITFRSLYVQVRKLVDRGVRYLLLISALLSVFIVFLIFYFTVREALPAIPGIGLYKAFGNGYSAYAKIVRELKRAEEGKLQTALGTALVAARSTLQDDKESALSGLADDEDLSERERNKRLAQVEAEYTCIQGFLNEVESLLESQLDEAELRAGVEAAQQRAVETALGCKLGFAVPPWAREVTLNGYGLFHFLTGSEWRPDAGKLGIWLMIVGSVLVTLMAIAMGVPLALSGAIFLAEVAPDWMRNIVRPAVELLAGIPSVVYGLFGMVVLVPLIGKIPVADAHPTNTGYGLFSATIVLAVMILPTITNIAEDAIRAVPRHYKEGSLALGATHWQTIISVILPAARSGIIAAVILGVGRALGETMAMIMVIGNSVRIAQPLNNNPLTIILSRTRTLTGNIAVEIAYATGLQEDAIFATGVVLFLMIMAVNLLARLVMRERKQT